MMLAIEADLQLTHAQSSSFYLLISIGYCLTLPFSGFISTRLNHNRTIALGCVVMGIGMALLFLHNSLIFVASALFLLGMGGGIYLPSGIAVVTSLVASKDYGKALSIHELAPNLSLCVAPLIAEPLLEITSWRNALGFIGLLAIVYGIIFALFGRGGNFYGKKPNFSLLTKIVRMRDFWILSLLFSLTIGASMGPYSILPLFLVDERSLPLDWALQLQSFSRMSGIFTACIAGWFVDRFGTKQTISFAMGITGLSTTLLGLTHGSLLTVMVFLQPVLAVFFFAAGFAMISTIFPEDERNIAVSLLTPIAVMGGFGIVPPFLGYLGDHGSFATGFVILGCVLLCSLLLTRLLGRSSTT